MAANFKALNQPQVGATAAIALCITVALYRDGPIPDATEHPVWAQITRLVSLNLMSAPARIADVPMNASIDRSWEFATMV